MTEPPSLGRPTYCWCRLELAGEMGGWEGASGLEGRPSSFILVFSIPSFTLQMRFIRLRKVRREENPLLPMPIVPDNLRHRSRPHNILNCTKLSPMMADPILKCGLLLPRPWSVSVPRLEPLPLSK
jgi:hypothetical protein